MSDLTLSIIIVNWNTRDLLAQCIQSIYANPPDASFDIWVVDNASSDGSAEMVRQRFPQVHLIENSENVGFARANNQAIRQSSGRYVLLLNPDTIVPPRAIQGLLEFLHTHPEAGAVGPRLVYPDGTGQQSWDWFPSLLDEILGARRCHRLPTTRSGSGHSASPAFEVDWVRGTCLMIPRETVESVGLLDEDYYMYSEEMDWCRRIRNTGYGVYHVPTILVVHVAGAAARQACARAYLLFHRSRLLYHAKHDSRPAYMAVRCVLALKAFLRLVTRLRPAPVKSQWADLLIFRWCVKGQVPAIDNTGLG